MPTKCVFLLYNIWLCLVIGYLNMGGGIRGCLTRRFPITQQNKKHLSISDITFTNQCRKYHGKCSIIPTIVENIMANGQLFLHL